MVAASLFALIAAAAIVTRILSNTPGVAHHFNKLPSWASITIAGAALVFSALFFVGYHMSNQRKQQAINRPASEVNKKHERLKEELNAIESPLAKFNEELDILQRQQSSFSDEENNESKRRSTELSQIESLIHNLSQARSIQYKRMAANLNESVNLD